MNQKEKRKPRPAYTINGTFHSEEDVQKVDQLAAESDMSRTAWVTAVVMDAVNSGVIYKRVVSTTKASK